MLKTKIYDAFKKPIELDKKEVINFLHKHLGKYGDSKSDIRKALDYSIKETSPFGGFTMLLYKDGELVGVTIINQTGMSGYIPENILVYIATHEDYRGQGLGKELMKRAIDHCKGDIALHVEADNPAKYLYEKLGFANPYLEMRLKK
jgi:GNAT superfamily N-acetyltransferase